MAAVMPQYECVMAPVRKILHEALFERADYVERDLVETAKKGFRVQTPEESFHGKIPYFQKCRELGRDLHQMGALVEQLQGHTAHLSSLHSKNQAQRNWLNAIEGALQAKKDLELQAKIGFTNGELGKMLSKHGHLAEYDAVAAMMDEYQKMDEEKKSEALVRLMTEGATNSDMVVKLLPEVMSTLAHRPRDNNFTFVMQLANDLLPSNGAEMLPRLIARKAKLPSKNQHSGGLLSRWIKETHSPSATAELLSSLCTDEPAGHFMEFVEEGHCAVAAAFHGHVLAKEVHHT
jgi:hypothetical protein